MLGFDAALPRYVVRDTNVLNTAKLVNGVISCTLRRRGVLAIDMDATLTNNTPIIGYTTTTDQYGYILTLIFPVETGVADGTVIKLSYDYDLLSFYRNERATYRNIRDSVTNQLSAKQAKLVTLESQKETQTTSLESYRTDKQELVTIFNNKMAPFLKEGTWNDSNYQPSFENRTLATVPLVFDPFAFIEEDSSNYMVGQTKTYYHAILLPTGLDEATIEQLIVTQHFTENTIDIIRELRYGAQYMPHFIYTKEVSSTQYDTVAELTKKLLARPWLIL